MSPWHDTDVIYLFLLLLASLSKAHGHCKMGKKFGNFIRLSTILPHAFVPKLALSFRILQVYFHQCRNLTDFAGEGKSNLFICFIKSLIKKIISIGIVNLLFLVHNDFNVVCKVTSL